MYDELENDEQYHDPDKGLDLNIEVWTWKDRLLCAVMGAALFAVFLPLALWMLELGGEGPMWVWGLTGMGFIMTALLAILGLILIVLAVFEGGDDESAKHGG